MFSLLDMVQILSTRHIIKFVKRLSVLMIYLLGISTNDAAIQSCEQFLMYITLMLRGENMPLNFI